MITRIHGLGLVAVALALGGCAAANSPAPKTAQDSTCLTSTGSRIPANGTTCTGIGRSYSQTDLEQTGKQTAAGALQMVDPSVTITH
ncbi:MAG TPA: hypothetical protein VME42_11570 [Steroidobacteraceae bacterium]|nr:hypothetical protein [Steroidobacteraceae bacterium]